MKVLPPELVEELLDCSRECVSEFEALDAMELTSWERSRLDRFRQILAKVRDSYGGSQPGQLNFFAGATHGHHSMEAQL